MPAPHLPWSANATNAIGTNSAADVWATPDELGIVYEDFARHFSDIRIQFATNKPDFRYHGVYSDMLLIGGSKSPSIMRRKWAGFQSMLR